MINLRNYARFNYLTSEEVNSIIKIENAETFNDLAFVIKERYSNLKIQLLETEDETEKKEIVNEIYRIHELMYLVLNVINDKLLETENRDFKYSEMLFFNICDNL